MSYLPYAIAGVALGGLLVVMWAIAVEPRRFRLRRVVLDAQALGLPPLRILHVTDTHFSGRDDAILAFLRRLAATESFDLAFFTGDLIDNGAGIRSATQAAGLFRARLGSFAVLGGHDYATVDPVKVYTHMMRGEQRQVYAARNPVEKLVQCLEEAGVRVLEDRNATLAAPEGGQFAVVGVRDVFMFDPDYDAAWRGLDGRTPVINIAHSPDVLRETCARGAKLAFFGHTHGGQVRLPFIGAVVTRSHLPRRLAHGAFRQGSTVFIVNNGLGTSPVIPYRFLCRPEVTVAELTCQAAPAALTKVQEARLG